MNPQVKTVCIVGAGSAGFLAAVTIKRLLPRLKVTIVYSPNVPVIGVGESTIDFFARFLHQHLQLERQRFFREVEPSWKLGVRLQWGPPDRSHFNYSFDRVLYSRPEPLRKRTAYYCLDDLQDAGPLSALMDRSLSPVLLSADGRHRLLPGAAYHLENKKFLAYLKRLAAELGVEFVEADVADVLCNEAGYVSELCLEDGQRLAADLFVDCSGFRSLILGKKLGVRYVSYADALFCDTAVIGSFQRTGDIAPYTTAETMDHGWCWKIEFRDRVTRGYVYSSHFCDQDDAVRELKTKNPKLGDDLRLVKFPSGRYENYWVKNVVAIGNASGFVEPLEATALHLIAVQLLSLCGALQDSDFYLDPRAQDLENLQFRRVWDDVRDFLAVHYKFNERLNTPFWQHCRRETQLGEAQALVEAYEALGPHRSCEVYVPRESIFAYDGYLAMFLGMRVATRYESRLTDEDHRDWKRYQESIRSGIANAAAVRESLEIVGN